MELVFGDADGIPFRLEGEFDLQVVLLRAEDDTDRWTIAGTALLAVALSGFLVRPVGWGWRAALTAAGIALLIPPVGPIAGSAALNIAGAAVGIVFVGLEWAASRRAVAPVVAPDRPV